MRIGLLAPPWVPVPPPAYGGTEAVVADLARGLSARGHDVTLFTVGESTCPVRRRHHFARAVEPFDQSMPEAVHVLAGHASLREAAVDVVHDHTLLGPLLAPRAAPGGPPVVVTHHGAFTAVSRALLRESARTAAVVAISQDHASRAGAVPIMAVVPHGIDLETYRAGPGGGDHLMFIGRMSPDKGVAEAVRIAHRAGRPLRIVAKMRAAEERAYFETRVRPLLSTTEDEVAELGTAERVDLLGRAAALLNPIAWPEPFGLVMAEALATGTPVIARPFGAAPEIVTHGRTGFLVADEADAVAAVHRIAEIDRRACRADAEHRFSLHQMAARYERVYARVREAAPRPGEPVLVRSTG